jgi:hypothetical protein
MARIKINDLPILEELPQEEQKGIFGGDGVGGSSTGPNVNISLSVFGGSTTTGQTYPPPTGNQPSGS